MSIETHEVYVENPDRFIGGGLTLTVAPDDDGQPVVSVEGEGNQLMAFDVAHLPAFRARLLEALDEIAEQAGR